MTRPQQIGLVTEVIRVMEDRQVTVMEVREIADVCAALLVSAFVGGFAGMMARSFAREALGLESKKKIRPALDLVLPQISLFPQAQRKDVENLDRLIKEKHQDINWEKWPHGSISDARKAVYRDILNGFGTVQEAKDYVEGMPEDSVLFTARGDEISFTLIKLIITDIERNPWLSPFKPERRPDISWQPPLMPKTETYYTISFQGDATFKTGEIVSEQAFRAENERVTKLGLRPARGWVTSKGELLSWGNGRRPVKELEEYLPASIPRDDLTRIADRYGWWAAKLAQSVCPHNDVACAEREARRLAEARRARLE